MRRAQKTFVIFTLITLLLCGYGYAALLPNIVQSRAQHTLQSFGFENAVLPKPEIRYGAVRFSNISLDAEQFSTIDYLDLYYSPLALMTSGKIDNIKIIGLNLTGEISNQYALSFAGWNKLKTNINPAALNFELLDIKKASLSVFTEAFNGIALSGDLQISRKDNNLEFQGHVNSTQKHIAFNAPLSGYITDHGFWQANLDIQRGKFALEHTKASRINGQVRFEKQSTKPVAILSQLNAGGLSFYDLPWHNASTTIEGTADDFKLFIGAKSLGQPGLDLSLQIEERNNQRQLSGTLNAPDIQSVQSYLEQENLTSRSSDINTFTGKDSINIEFDVEKTENSKEIHLIYKIKNKDKDADIEGKIKIFP